MPGYGYREERKARDRSESSSHTDRGAKKRSKAEKKLKKGKKRRRSEDNLEGGPSRPLLAADIQTSIPPAEVTPARRGGWREELETSQGGDDDVDSDGIVPMETDEDVERKLAESRARREALIAKWVNRGEEPGLQFENTNTSLHDEEEGEDSDGEVAAFFAARQKQLSNDGPIDKEALEKKKAVNRFILEHRGEHDGDMFTEDAGADQALNRTINTSAAIATTGASADDWNDAEGYYRAKIGEVMDDRYLVTEDLCGKGVFSNVVKAKDQHNKDEAVAIKVMRCNDMMRAAAEKEIEVLERLNQADRGNKRNVIRLIRHFMYRGHLCLVFECMWDNLRVALKKYTKDKGMSLRAVRAYAKQLLVAIQHIHRCGIIHADIKPDNILISAGHNITKICDLGSAVELTEIEPTPYLVSRFYRAPEIVLGAKYGPPCDIFALGASLCEIFTGKILFPGRSNNDMLRHFMELKGKPPKQFIKSGMTWKQHFDENLDFQYVDSDKVTRKKKVKVITDCSAKRSIVDLILSRVGPEKQKSVDQDDQLYVKKAKQFADLIDQMTRLDPEKRATPEDLMKHPFLTENMPTPKPAVMKDGKVQPAPEKK